ncbi:uncharacterized protein LOC143372872 isoform X2 [Andrena cerasifolii]|uniref:uncharacterized protein LOC143372872 isoform X2 n=1 Tax=Andrena cerasifolii TaxID=2819439 RepID=UPI004037C4CB
MEQFISTYQKDYAWPSRRIKHTPPSLLKEGGSCRCSTRSREIKVVDPCGDEHEWSRLGPMGRLLDAKLYPAKTGPYPETEASKHDQPGTYIRKSTPIDEIIQRVDRDRLKTTYQVDFSETAAAATDEMARGPCAASGRPPEDIDCRPSARSGVLKRDRGASGTGDIGDVTKKKGEDDSQETRLPPWRSEYQDGISRLGHAIIKTRIHHKRTAAPAWAMAAF